MQCVFTGRLTAAGADVWNQFVQLILVKTSEWIFPYLSIQYVPDQDSKGRITLTSLADVLHNIADHTQTLWQLLATPSVPADIARRLKQHMTLEEQENTAKLQAMQAVSPSLMIQKLLDHSFLIQRLMQEEESMPLDLRKELLDHFMEEHLEWTAEISPTGGTRNWTVGPLWPQGG